jgi:cytochrome c1
MKFLQNVDRRIIYILVFLALAVPLLNPIGLPFSINDAAQHFYDKVDALQPGDVVCVSWDYSPSGSAQLDPQGRAVLKHLYSKPGIKIVNVSFWPSGPLFNEKFQKEMEGTHDKVYGEDYVNLGYVAGAETAISSFAKDIQATFANDRQGNNVSDIPMMKDIKTAADLDLLVQFGTGTPGVPEVVRQIVTGYGTDFVAGMNSVSVAGNVPYYNAGQVQGYLNGLRGAAEYEMMLGKPGPATASMDSLSFSHLTVIVFILLGNIAYFTNPDRKKR